MGMSDEQTTYYIYGLIDPRDNKIRYVGCTTRPVGRYLQHCGEHAVDNGLSYGHPKNKWTSQLRAAGLTPGIKKLDETKGKENGLRLERHWIEVLRLGGAKLFNSENTRDYRKRTREEVFSTGR